MQSGRAASHSACKPQAYTRVEGGDSVKGGYFKQRSTPPTESTVADFQIHQQEIRRKIKYIHVAIVKADGWQGKMGINLSSRPLTQAQTVSITKCTTIGPDAGSCPEAIEFCPDTHTIAYIYTEVWLVMLLSCQQLTPRNRSFLKMTVSRFVEKQPLKKLEVTSQRLQQSWVTLRNPNMVRYSSCVCVLQRGRPPLVRWPGLFVQCKSNCCPYQEVMPLPQSTKVRRAKP